MRIYMILTFLGTVLATSTACHVPTRLTQEQKLGMLHMSDKIVCDGAPQQDGEICLSPPTLTIDETKKDTDLTKVTEVAYHAHIRLPFASLLESDQHKEESSRLFLWATSWGIKHFQKRDPRIGGPFRCKMEKRYEIKKHSKYVYMVSFICRLDPHPITVYITIPEDVEVMPR